MSLGEKIKYYRELQNMTQEDLAFKLRVGPGKIQKYESGLQTPTTETILRLSTILEIPAADLIEEISEQPYDQFS